MHVNVGGDFNDEVPKDEFPPWFFGTRETFGFDKTVYQVFQKEILVEKAKFKKVIEAKRDELVIQYVTG